MRGTRSLFQNREILPDQLVSPADAGRPSVGAFTILEIVMVLAITVLLIGAATPAISGMLKAEKLKAPARELEAMAITARTKALSEQRPYQIVIRGNGFRLERSAGEQGHDILEEYTLPQGIVFEMATWPKEKWEKVREHLWYFPPSGLCEPIRVMFRKGDSFFSQNYSAVTGWAQEETFFIR